MKQNQKRHPKKADTQRAHVHPEKFLSTEKPLSAVFAQPSYAQFRWDPFPATYWSARMHKEMLLPVLSPTSLSSSF